MSFASMHNDYLDPDRYFAADEMIDLAPAISAAGMPHIVGYWDEDGQLFAGRKYDEDGRLPHVGDSIWDDEKTEDENATAAADIIAGIFKPDEERRARLEDQLFAYRVWKRRHPATVPTFSAWCKSMGFPPEGDFEWDDSEAGDPHVYNCGDSDCPVGWHKAYYAQTITRADGKVSILVRSVDEGGNSDVSDGFDQGEPAQNWRHFYRQWLADLDSYFVGWAEYHLECARTNADPLGDFMDPSKACSSAAHLEAAEDNIKCLPKVPHGRA